MSRSEKNWTVDKNYQHALPAPTGTLGKRLEEKATENDNLGNILICFFHGQKISGATEVSTWTQEEVEPRVLSGSSPVEGGSSGVQGVNTPGLN